MKHLLCLGCFFSFLFFFFVFCPVPFCRAYSDAMPLYLQETGVRGGKGQGKTGVVLFYYFVYTGMREVLMIHMHLRNNSIITMIVKFSMGCRLDSVTYIPASYIINSICTNYIHITPSLSIQISFIFNKYIQIPTTPKGHESERVSGERGVEIFCTSSKPPDNFFFFL